MGGTHHSHRPLPGHRVCGGSVVLPGRPRPTARATVVPRKTSIRCPASSGARATIVALLNQPHGVGKTTLALHLAGLWSYRTRHITVIDADPQGRTLGWCGRRNGFRGASLSAVSRGTRFTAPRRTLLVTSIG